MKTSLLRLLVLFHCLLLYMTGHEAAVPIWNTTNQPLTVDIRLDTKAVLSSGQTLKTITLLETGRRIPHQLAGLVVIVKVLLLAHEVVLLIK